MQILSFYVQDLSILRVGIRGGAPGTGPPGYGGTTVFCNALFLCFIVPGMSWLLYFTKASVCDGLLEAGPPFSASSLRLTGQGMQSTRTAGSPARTRQAEKQRQLTSKEGVGSPQPPARRGEGFRRPRWWPCYDSGVTFLSPSLQIRGRQAAEVQVATQGKRMLCLLEKLRSPPHPMHASQSLS